MSWKIGVPIMLALTGVAALLQPTGCGGLGLASLLTHLAISANGVVIAMIVFRDEIVRA